jgi:glycosyltransferase involved in cell wall biosynthesis
MSDNKTRILMIGHLPPPPEGTAKVNELIINSPEFRKAFDIKFISLKKRTNVHERGKLGLLNVADNIRNAAVFTAHLISYNLENVYLPIAQNKLGFLRDSLFINLAAVFGKKVCAHFHGGGFDSFYLKQNIVYKWHIRRSLAKIDRLILLAHKIKPQFEPFVRSEKIRVIYNCASAPAKQDKVVKSTSDYFQVLFIGYISKAKGAYDMVRSLPEVVNRHKGKVKYILCGAGVDKEPNINYISDPHNGYSDTIKFIENNALSEYVELKGVVTGNEKEKLLRESDIFVFPSYSEGFPMSLLEAMSYGLPIVCTPVGAIGEMLGERENCLFVTPGDIKVISDAVNRLCDDPKLRIEMGNRNRELIKNKYNLDNFIASLVEVWRNMAQRS